MNSFRWGPPRLPSPERLPPRPPPPFPPPAPPPLGYGGQKDDMMSSLEEILASFERESPREQDVAQARTMPKTGARKGSPFRTFEVTVPESPQNVVSAGPVRNKPKPASPSWSSPGRLPGYQRLGVAAQYYNRLPLAGRGRYRYQPATYRSPQQRYKPPYKRPQTYKPPGRYSTVPPYLRNSSPTRNPFQRYLPQYYKKTPAFKVQNAQQRWQTPFVRQNVLQAQRYQNPLYKSPLVTASPYQRSRNLYPAFYPAPPERTMAYSVGQPNRPLPGNKLSASSAQATVKPMTYNSPMYATQQSRLYNNYRGPYSNTNINARPYAYPPYKTPQQASISRSSVKKFGYPANPNAPGYYGKAYGQPLQNQGSYRSPYGSSQYNSRNYNTYYSQQSRLTPQRPVSRTVQQPYQVGPIASINCS